MTDPPGSVQKIWHVDYYSYRFDAPKNLREIGVNHFFSITSKFPSIYVQVSTAYFFLYYVL